MVRHQKEGVLFSKGDFKALAQVIKNLASDPEQCLRLGQAGRERVKAFDITQTAQQYVELFKTCIV